MRSGKAVARAVEHPLPDAVPSIVEISSVVIYSPEDCESVWGNMPTQESIQKLVNHYCWDSPIYARFEINGKEYAYEETPFYDEYEWKRKEFIEWVAKESGVAGGELDSFVPEYPEYN